MRTFIKQGSPGKPFVQCTTYVYYRKVSIPSRGSGNSGRLNGGSRGSSPRRRTGLNVLGSDSLDVTCIPVDHCRQRKAQIEARVLEGCKPECCGLGDYFADYFMDRVRETRPSALP